MEKTEIQESLLKNHAEFTGFIGGLTDVVARNSMPGKWTPLQQLDHIAKSVGPVKLAFSVPKFVLPPLFGRANRASLSYSDLVTKYQSKLSAGGKSPTRFLPDTTCDRVDMIKMLEGKVQTLANKVDRFSEEELDHYILPHPLLGKVTMREMLYFTIYHVEHHHKQVNINMARLATVTA